ncbi:MAG: DinB family protein [Planctomycetota bacterium]
MVIDSYIGDLSDEELMMRPHPGCNKVAWQLGHLICSEADLLKSIGVEHGLELSAEFVETHAKENAASDDPSGYLTKVEYVALFEKLKQRTSDALAAIDDAQLDSPGPEFLKGFADTVGAVYVLIATHGMMHAGQFVPVRRECDKPIVI